MKLFVPFIIATFLCSGCKPAMKIAKDKQFQEKVGKTIVVGGATGASKEAGGDIYHLIKGDEPEKKKPWWSFGKE